MEFMADWKSLWPVSSMFSAPLFIPNNNPQIPIGPVIFSPSPNSTTLLHSSSLSPRLPPPYQKLTLPHFLQNYDSIPSSSISSLLGPQHSNWSSEFHGFNSLQLLQVPDKNLVIVFFRSGENSDQVGFCLLSLKDGVLGLHSLRENLFHVVKEGNTNRHRIKCLLVNPVDDFGYNDNGDDIVGHGTNSGRLNNATTVVGFLMVCTDFSVYWYRVGISTINSVCLDYVGCANAKMLRGSAVVSACWSPHLSEECMVLLENGDLLLFDVNYSGKQSASIFLVSGNNRFVDIKMRVPLSAKLGMEEESHYEGQQWFGCEFSWHPRLFIVCHCHGVFLVDLRSAKECNVCCLLKPEVLSMQKSDEFLSLSKAASDGFYFIVATRNLLLLSDVRKPMMPLLQWAHGVRNPRYMSVFRLSELRANPKDTRYKSASESGYCVILGSFWDNNFTLFCYGPDPKADRSVHSEVSKFCHPYYAWGLPSELPLSGSECKCGSCLVREEFWKASLPVWTDWRHKKDVVLGFGILNPDLFAQVFAADSNGGFMLIRLSSSGKLEAQNYFADWAFEKIPEAGHKRKSIYMEDNLMYDCDYSEYDGVKIFQHLNFDFLNAHLEDKLAKYIVNRREKIKENDEDLKKKYVVKAMANYHQEICPQMKAFRFTGGKSSHPYFAVLKDISWPTSIHEIALRSAFASLNINLLQLAFSTYSDFDEESKKHNEPLEFLDIPDQLQLPPFPLRKPSYRSSKWSGKVQPPDTLVGPILPPHFLTTLNVLWMDELKEERVPYLEESEEFSAHSQFKLQCDGVLEAVQEHISGSDVKTQDDFISLADDTENLSNESQKLNLSCHKPSAFLEKYTSTASQKSDCENYVYSTHVFRRTEELGSDLNTEMVGEKLFDMGCPIELKFDDFTIDLGQKELELFRNLKKRDLEFQKCFKPYQDYIVRDDEQRRQ